METLEEIKYARLEEQAAEYIKEANYKDLLELAYEYEIFDIKELIDQLIDVAGAIQVARDLGFEL